jgi:RNA polymerase sigma factor (sigma-70 family)
MTNWLAEAYRTHAHQVVRRARQILGEAAEADEVLQEVFLSLVDEPEQFQRRSALSTWLYSATTHLCLNKLRNRRNRLRILEEQVAPGRTESVRARADDWALARQLLASMPEDLARVAVYYYVDEMTHQEIAEQVGCSRRHVGNLVERVIRFGQEWAGRQGEPDIESPFAASLSQPRMEAVR